MTNLLGETMTNTAAAPGAREATLIRLPLAARWLVAAAACAVVLACAALLSAGAARAATIDGAITSITTTATGTTQWDRVDFGCTWAVPDGSAPGDTFSLDLPVELKWFGATDFALAGPDGQSVALAHADPTGHVVFTLTDYVLTHQTGVHGSCHFATQYAAQTSDGTSHLDFQVGGEVIRVDLPTTAPCSPDCTVDRGTPSKYMWWDDAAQTTTQSVIRASATDSDSSVVTLTDVPGPGLALDCASLTVTIGKVLDAQGYVTDPRDDTLYPPVVTCTTQGASVTWSDVAAGEYAELWVRADVVDPSAATYTNQGTVTVNGRTAPVWNEVRASDAGGDGTGSPTSTTSTTTTSTTTSPTSTSPTSTTSTTTSPTSTTSTSTSPTSTTSTTTTSTTTTSTTTSPTSTSPTSTSPTSTSPTSTTSTTTAPTATNATSTSGTSTTSAATTAPTGTTTRPTRTIVSAATLAFTGSDAGRLALVAALLLGTGVLLSVAGRRARRH
ncbi:hypothetical protein SAMN04489867_3662 [Pedococcus dokdonensis]|uniref:Uncharacterized protein n=1 Tax=Pedococcus dokdonensis TaxID=443156 RepID=A0A1H0V4Z7_9MICO|nr:Ig-like domain-containing protein [Pedococcus dokdonensis]SDP73248.1 hypothetical protein SAMN04489867_3662 [Pedococcus dokdonensis]